MSKFVVVSLYTDGLGPRANEFGELRAHLTGSVSNPMYAIVDPFEGERVLYQADYNAAVADNFADKLARVKRRVGRNMIRRGVTTSVD